MALFKRVCLLLYISLLAFTFTTSADAQRTLPPIPCIPGRPRPPWLPPCSSPPSPQPAECYTSVSGLTPCAGFLTSAGVPLVAPSSACCDGLRSLVADAPVCVCHVVNGDLSRLLPAPMVPRRMVQLPRLCAVPFPRATLRRCIRGPVPPMNPPLPIAPPAPERTPPASPPESPPEPPSTPPEASPPEAPSTPPEASSPPESSPPETPSSPPETPSSPPETPSTPETPSIPPAASRHQIHPQFLHQSQRQLRRQHQRCCHRNHPPPYRRRQEPRHRNRHRLHPHHLN